MRKRALHGDHISPGGTEPSTGAITRREEPAGPLSSTQRCESSCGMLRTWPGEERGQKGGGRGSLGRPIGGCGCRRWGATAGCLEILGRSWGCGDLGTL